MWLGMNQHHSLRQSHFRCFECLLLGSSPCEKFICQHQEWRLQDLSTSEDKAVAEIEEANKLLQCFVVLGNWKRANRFNMGNVGTDSSCANGVAQEVHL